MFNVKIPLITEMDKFLLNINTLKRSDDSNDKQKKIYELKLIEIFDILYKNIKSLLKYHYFNEKDKEEVSNNYNYVENKLNLLEKYKETI